MIVGGDGGDLGVGHRHLRVVSRQLQVLLVLLGTVVAARQGQDQRITALKLAERPHRPGVVGESVIREDAARPDVRTHWMTASRNVAGETSTVLMPAPLNGRVPARTAVSTALS